MSDLITTSRQGKSALKQSKIAANPLRLSRFYSNFVQICLKSLEDVSKRMASTNRQKKKKCL